MRTPRTLAATTCALALGAGALLSAPRFSRADPPTAATPAAATATATAAPPAPSTAPVRAPTMAFERYTLPNGLEVILHEDHRTPTVAVNIWYHVGGKDEPQGRNGF